jgi:hypothetical protein
VRDELWKKVTDRPALGYVLQLWSRRAPPGFLYRQYGASKRMLQDFDGLALVTVHGGGNKKARMAARRERVRAAKSDTLGARAAPDQESPPPF